jgi:hypothetical protein
VPGAPPIGGVVGGPAGASVPRAVRSTPIAAAGVAGICECVAGAADGSGSRGGVGGRWGGIGRRGFDKPNKDKRSGARAQRSGRAVGRPRSAGRGVESVEGRSAVVVGVPGGAGSARRRRGGGGWAWGDRGDDGDRRGRGRERVDPVVADVRGCDAGRKVRADRRYVRARRRGVRVPRGPVAKGEVDTDGEGGAAQQRESDQCQERADRADSPASGPAPHPSHDRPRQEALGRCERRGVGAPGRIGGESRRRDALNLHRSPRQDRRRSAEHMPHELALALISLCHGNHESPPSQARCRPRADPAEPRRPRSFSQGLAVSRGRGRRTPSAAARPQVRYPWLRPSGRSARQTRAFLGRSPSSHVRRSSARALYTQALAGAPSSEYPSDTHLHKSAAAWVQGSECE